MIKIMSTPQGTGHKSILKLVHEIREWVTLNPPTEVKFNHPLRKWRPYGVLEH